MEISKITSPSEWVYFAQGNANILFKYSGSNDYLRHKLLRVRLLKEHDQYISTCELYDFIELKCKDLFPRQIVDVQLVVLTTDFVNALDNKESRVMLTERYGLLIPNILDGDYSELTLSKKCLLFYDHCGPNDKTNSVIFEIKPKWLYDNYSCNYCRTCLLNQLRGLRRHFCPLDLLYPERIDIGLCDIFEPIPPDILHRIQVENGIPLKKLFRNFLLDPKNVFRQLKQYQRINSKNDLIKNLSSKEDVLQKLSLVMTLRDVGLFIKFEKFDSNNNSHTSHHNIRNVIAVDGHGKFLVTCNIYDLDLKSNAKYRHWIDIEQRLRHIHNSKNPQWRPCYKTERIDDTVSDFEA